MALALVEVSATWLTATFLLPVTPPLGAEAFASLASGLLLALSAAALIIWHAWPKTPHRLPARGAMLAAALILIVAAAAHLFGTSHSDQASAYLRLCSVLLAMLALALLLIALARAVVATGARWRAHLYAQLSGLALVGIALVVLATSGEAVPHTRLFEASLAVRIFAGCVLLLGSLVGAWVVLGLCMMRKEFTLRRVATDEGVSRPVTP